MKVGILTYNAALNFGANLQACSTYSYFKNKGYDPVFISYTPYDASNEDESCPLAQVKVQREFQTQFAVTRPCHNSVEVAEVLSEEGIHNVVVGSDAVTQHQPFLSRIVFPSKKLFSVLHPTSDKMFPNPYWGEFLDYVEGEISVSAMSVSSQQSNYIMFSSAERKKMLEYVSRFKYISVRDDWTQSMFISLSGGLINPMVTPDPVFAFNWNVKGLPTLNMIKEKFNLPDKYVLLAIRKGRSVTADWVKAFEKECEKHGYKCIGLPFPYGYSPLNVLNEKIELPLSPIEWYSIIKYSNGFVGHNMHTIVTALHNAVPCYSFDQYGIRYLSQFVNSRSSKIYHILNTAGFPDNRCPSCRILEGTPSANIIFSKLMTFDREKCKSFAEQYYQKYQTMMADIESNFIND